MLRTTWNTSCRLFGGRRATSNIWIARPLRQNEQTQDAVVRNIEIIGEAASRIQSIAPEFVVSHPELPWIEMRGMRNKMIHEYFDVDWAVVWSTVKDDPVYVLSSASRCGT